VSVGFVYVDNGKAPKGGPKNGTTDRCAHEGCPMVLRFKNGGWVHSIRNRAYDHEPVPVNHAPATQQAAMPADEAIAKIFAGMQ